MKKAVQLLSFICVLTLAVSCGKKPKTTSKESSTDTQAELQSESVSDLYEIPQIAFLMSVDYSPVRDEEPLYTYVLYDKNGDVFYTEDTEVTSMRWDLLLEKYSDGSISDKLTKVKTIEDKDGLLKCIDKLQIILHKTDYRLIAPDPEPDVLWEITRWEGLYYDENHELKMVYLRYSEYLDHKANDPRADEIIEFLTSD